MLRKPTRAIRLSSRSRGAANHPNHADPAHPFHPTLRFMGLISPVGQMPVGSMRLDIGWQTQVPAQVQHLVQALDNQPNSLAYPQTQMSRTAANPADQAHIFPYDHPTIGVMNDVMRYLVKAASDTGVPVHYTDAAPYQK